MVNGFEFLLAPIYSYPFMQRSLIAVICLGTILPILGLNMTTKRLSMIGDALSHTALAGVAIGLLVGWMPVAMSVVVSVVAGVAIELIRNQFSKYSELSLAIVMSVSVGIAGILTKYVSSNRFDSYLFGSVNLVTPDNLWIIIPVSVFIVLFTLAFYRTNMYVSYNQYEAKISGLPVKTLNMLNTVFTAAAVALSSSIIGSLVVASLLVIPVATSLQFSRSYFVTMIAAIALSLVSGVVGLTISFPWGTNSGATIVVIATGFLAVALAGKGIARGVSALVTSRRNREANGGKGQ